MAGQHEEERDALIDALHAAIARAKVACARAEIARKDAQAIRAFHIREKVTAARVLSPGVGARLVNDLESASRDLEKLRARIESAKPAMRTPRMRRRR